MSLFFKQVYFLIILVLLSGKLLACQCPGSELNLKETEKYEVIFRAKVLEVKTCENKPGEAVFEVLELYKGNAELHFKVLFDCHDPCYYEFRAGEEWIIYSRYKQVNTACMDYCSRSRKLFSNSKEDYYTVSNGNEYEEELHFLRKNLGLHRLVENDNSNDFSRNRIPNTNQAVIILLVSMAAIVGFYFFVFEVREIKLFHIQ